MIISRFTPSLMPREVLERIFVARETVLEMVKDRINSAVERQTLNHTLLIGPRGSGKTHLIALAYYHTRDLMSAGNALQVSWLPEDPWRIAGYRNLLFAILDGLEPDVPSLGLTQTEGDLEARLIDIADRNGTVVVLIENFDHVLSRLGELGQQQLRHLLQSSQSLLIVATTTRLDRDLSDQAKPFYGYFTTTRLAPFTVAQAQEMLRALAVEAGDHELADQLGTTKTTARLRTISHLAGGQPRLWAALANALTIEQLDSLVELFMTRFDDLTPYYQEQLARLSPQQQLITAELADADHPVHVAELASRLDIDQRSLSKTIAELVDRGWIAPVVTPVVELLDRRRTYYELAEPLARISFQIKESRGRPLKIILEFLRSWFDPEEITRSNESSPSLYLELAASDLARDAVTSVARKIGSLPVPWVPALELLGSVDDALADIEAGNADAFLCLPTAIRVALEARFDDAKQRQENLTELRTEMHQAALAEIGEAPHPAKQHWLRRAENLATQSTVPTAQLVLSKWLSSSGSFDEAALVLRVAQRVLGSTNHDVVDAQLRLADGFRSAGRVDAAIDLAEAVLRDCEARLTPTHLDTLRVATNLAIAYGEAGRLAPALELFQRTLAERERILGANHPDTVSSRNNLAVSYEAAGRANEAVELLERAVSDWERLLGRDHPHTLSARNNLAAAYRSAGRLDDAISLFERTLVDRQRVLGPDHPATLSGLNNLAVAYLGVGRFNEAIPLLERTLVDRQRVLGPDHPDALSCSNNLAAAYEGAGRLDEAIPLIERTVVDCQRVFGADHPSTLHGRNNLAIAYQSAGRLDEAIALFIQALRDRERVLGLDHPDTLSARNNLAVAYQAAGLLTEAIALFERTLADQERVLGLEHPDTVSSRTSLAVALQSAHR
jgi:tetratricopeptide (TPR) repeat protein